MYLKERKVCILRKRRYVFKGKEGMYLKERKVCILRKDRYVFEGNEGSKINLERKGQGLWKVRLI